MGHRQAYRRVLVNSGLSTFRYSPFHNRRPDENTFLKIPSSKNVAPDLYPHQVVLQRPCPVEGKTIRTWTERTSRWAASKGLTRARTLSRHETPAISAAVDCDYEGLDC